MLSLVVGKPAEEGNVNFEIQKSFICKVMSYEDIFFILLYLFHSFFKKAFDGDYFWVDTCDL